MATDYSRHVFRELELATAEIENLKRNVIPELKKEYEAKLYNERASAAEKNSALRKEKDSEISGLKSRITELESRLQDAENEVVRLRNMMNKDSTNSSKPPSTDKPWECKGKQKAANETATHDNPTIRAWHRGRGLPVRVNCYGKARTCPDGRRE